MNLDEIGIAWAGIASLVHQRRFFESRLPQVGLTRQEAVDFFDIRECAQRTQDESVMVTSGGAAELFEKNCVLSTTAF